MQTVSIHALDIKSANDILSGHYALIQKEFNDGSQKVELTLGNGKTYLVTTDETGVNFKRESIGILQAAREFLSRGLAPTQARLMTEKFRLIKQDCGALLVLNANDYQQDKPNPIKLDFPKDARLPEKLLTVGTLVGATLNKAVGRNADLNSAQLNSAQLMEADLENAHATKNPANFENANLYGANLKDAQLPKAIFKKADLRQSTLTGIDLSGADLTNADLRYVDLRNVNLSGANLTNANLQGVELDGANLSGANLTNAKLGGVNLRGANLKGAILSGQDLSEVDLSYMDLSGADLTGTNLSGANLTGTNLSGANLTNATLRMSTLKSALNLKEVKSFAGADLSDTDLHNTDLTGLNFKGANFSNAKLIGAILKGATLTNANLSDANLSGANLENAILQEATLIDTNLYGAKFSEADLTDTDLRFTKNLRFANLGTSILIRANLSNMYLEGARLEGANLKGANLRHANLKGANLDNVVSDETTVLDSGLLTCTKLNGGVEINKLRDAIAAFKIQSQKLYPENTPSQIIAGSQRAYIQSIENKAEKILGELSSLMKQFDALKHNPFSSNARRQVELDALAHSITQSIATHKAALEKLQSIHTSNQKTLSDFFTALATLGQPSTIYQFVTTRINQQITQLANDQTQSLQITLDEVCNKLFEGTTVTDEGRATHALLSAPIDARNQTESNKNHLKYSTPLAKLLANPDATWAQVQAERSILQTKQNKLQSRIQQREPLFAEITQVQASLMTLNKSISLYTNTPPKGKEQLLKANQTYAKAMAAKSNEIWHVLYQLNRQLKQLDVSVDQDEQFQKRLDEIKQSITNQVNAVNTLKTTYQSSLKVAKEFRDSIHPLTEKSDLFKWLVFRHTNQVHAVSHAAQGNLELKSDEVNRNLVARANPIKTLLTGPEFADDQTALNTQYEQLCRPLSESIVNPQSKWDAVENQIVALQTHKANLINQIELYQKISSQIKTMESDVDFDEQVKKLKVLQTNCNPTSTFLSQQTIADKNTEFVQIFNMSKVAMEERSLKASTAKATVTDFLNSLQGNRGAIDDKRSFYKPQTQRLISQLIDFEKMDMRLMGKTQLNSFTASTNKLIEQVSVSKQALEIEEKIDRFLSNNLKGTMGVGTTILSNREKSYYPADIQAQIHDLMSLKKECDERATQANIDRTRQLSTGLIQSIDLWSDEHLSLLSTPDYDLVNFG